MKKYSEPSISVIHFDEENIVTLSIFSLKDTVGGSTAENYGSTDVESVLGTND